MEIIKKKFRALEESRKKQVIFFCVSMCLLIVFYVLSLNVLSLRFKIVEDDYSWVYQVDSIEEKDGELQIAGWAFILNQDAKTKNFKIVLHNTVTGKNIYPKMLYESREDVNGYFLCEYDYRESGFAAFFSLEKIENVVYEILLRPEGEDYAFSTGFYYETGEILYTNPNKFVSLDVIGTDLEPIVKKGIIRVYRPDCGMYVYQYDGELYWIAEPYYEFVNNDMYVQYQMNTTQINNLPTERIENGWFWSNMGFMFRDNEVIEKNMGKYRVAKCNIPTEYSVTHIYTGEFKDKWLWREDFRPWYELAE